jgi:putative MATE family efflux protein
MKRTYSTKEILTIAVPLMIGGISESISAVVDTAFMGRIGSLEMDGTGFASIIMLLIMMIGWSNSRSIQVMVSQNFGAKNDHFIGKIVDNAFYYGIPIAFLLNIIIYNYGHHFIYLIISNEKIAVIGNNVFQIRACGIVLVYIMMIFNGFHIGIGQTRVILVSQLIGAISNILINYILVFGHLGIEPMGYRGSAWATVLSEVIGLLVYIVNILWIQRALIHQYFLFKFKKWHFDIIRNLYKLSIPLIFQHAASLGAWIYFFALIERMGKNELAVSIVLRHIFAILAIPGFCLANTSNTIVGRLVGERNIESIIPNIIKICLISFGILVTFASLIFIFHTPVISIFSKDLYVIHHSFMPLCMLLLSYVILPFSNVTFNSILGLGDSKVVMFIELIGIVFYVVYIYTVIVVLRGNLMLAWTSEIFYWVSMLFFSAGYFYFFNWKKRIVFFDKSS